MPTSIKFFVAGEAVAQPRHHVGKGRAYLPDDKGGKVKRWKANVLHVVRELRGTVCRCGRKKQTRQTFCRKCYFSLSVEQRRALYRRIGAGYEEAYAAAIATLGLECRRCSECEGQRHHWIESYCEASDAYVGCKHCSAVADPCPDCDAGQVTDVNGALVKCRKCKGTGIVNIRPGRSE